MINNESQNHCKKVIGIIHTGSIGIADTLLTKLRATGENITPQSCSIVSNHHFTTHVVTYSCRARECDERTAAEIESSHTTGILKNHVDLILGSGRLSRSCYTTRYDHVTHFFIYFTSSHSLLSCQPILPTLRM